MRIDSLAGRVFIALTGLLVVVLAAGAIYGEISVRAFQEAGIRQRLETATKLLEASAEDALAGRVPHDVFERRLRDLGPLTGLRLTLIASDGLVLADSEATGPLANHATRPEVLEALASGDGVATRVSATTGKLTTYDARRIGRDDHFLGWIRAAQEDADVQSALTRLHESVLWLGLLALGLGVVSAVLLTRWIARPIEAVERDASALVSGALDRRIRSDGPLEVRRLADTLNAMSRELRERAETSLRARTEIETILSSMAEGVVAVDEKERVVLMNQAAARLLGLQDPLESTTALWEHLRFPELEIGLRAVLAGQPAWHGDAPTPLQDGRTLGLSVARVAMPEGPDAPFLGAVALLSDVTAIRRLEQVRIDFVANVSHELRTPLAAVMGALETLADPEQDRGTRARFLDIANRNAARLQAIVSDLLDLSSIEAEGDRMPLERIKVDGPLRTAAGALAGAAESKGVRLELPPPLREGAWVNGNAQRLEQVFTNLLENALKYTETGGRVSARLRVGKRDVNVDVEDTGIGIPASSLPRVFERFYRVDRSRSREMGGTGLGLAIVKHVLRAHGGQVAVKSEEGRGTTFTVTLPRIQDTERGPDPATALK